MERIAIQTESVNLTEEQFFRLCADNDDLRFERDKDKNIIVMLPTGSATGNFNAEISAMLGNWNRKDKTGYCFGSSAGFTLPNGAVRSPDVSWISKARWEAVANDDKEKFAHICPDFVIELVSKTDSMKESKLKMDEWMGNGCQLGWLIERETKATYIYKPNAEIKQQSFEVPLSGEDVLAGFELKFNYDTCLV